ncbi:N-acetylmuramoyl-L-alanine amidase [Prosthecobacter fusiformis]|uniref:N-acetylmuramoyl-L-alanine amidase n=1 Tax=Prosthecobacter fusiformis TaxID=48464 RepID=A0A4R7RZ17_9BACT|nr:N-acetylmuramoyl-L-alanine amidase [Prosthecobacter fusiformis]TDU71101.1 N-acetylmuramoyl-L-alanine amidase [Prosthecobacter fusiformis]
MLFLFKNGRFWLAALLGSASAASAQVVPAPETLPPDPLRFAKVSPLGKEPDWAELKVYAGTLTRDEFQNAWQEIYSPEMGLPPPFDITPDELVVPTGDPTDPTLVLPFRKPAGEGVAPEASWRRAADLPPLRGRPPLSDLHIALDPGHIGGAWAQIEERFLSFKPGESIREGDLSLLTAQVLTERLKALGARVSLVRDKAQPVTEQRPADFERLAQDTLKEHGILAPLPTYAGLQGDAKILTVQWQTEKLFYRVSEIHARAEKVNSQIKPDIVLCLHLNAEAWGPSNAPQFSPQNHLHVLVNGCYAPVELEQQDVRYEMLTRLFNRVHEEEIPLANAVAEGMARVTGLPAYIYTTPNARKAGTNPYVYARNLLANRLYQCPVVYLEPFVMNHEETYRRLLAGHYVGRTLIAGRLQSSALEDYVRGIVQGLLSYYQNQRRP